jgi:hypothetical protein
LLGYNKLINANHDKKVLVNFNKGIISVYVADKFGERTKIDKHNTPKELIDINNAEKLDKYLDNTFALVSVSNNGDYSVKIERRCLGGMFGGNDKDTHYMFGQKKDENIPNTMNVWTPSGYLSMNTLAYRSDGIFNEKLMMDDAYDRARKKEDESKVLNNNCYGMIDYSPLQQTASLEVKISDSFFSSVGQGAAIGASVGMFNGGLLGAATGGIFGATEGAASSFIFDSNYNLSSDSYFKK